MGVSPNSIQLLVCSAGHRTWRVKRLAPGFVQVFVDGGGLEDDIFPGYQERNLAEGRQCTEPFGRLSKIDVIDLELDLLPKQHNGQPAGRTDTV